MDVEKTILNLIPGFLKAYDTRKQGVTIDIGVGTFSFYFEVFAKSGYKTIAVEPLPSEKVKILTNQLKKSKLIEACILDYDGQTDIFTGSFQGRNAPDVSSVNKDWWGVSDEKSTKKVVRSISLQRLVEEYQINNITFCKIDTEGSEYTIIKQFENISPEQHPKILEFEYGGGGTKGNTEAGWNNKYLQSTFNCIQTLFDLGYKYLVLFERENERPIEIVLEDKAIIRDIFKDFYVYGDILMMKERKYSFYSDTGVFSFASKKSWFSKLKNFFHDRCKN